MVTKHGAYLDVLGGGRKTLKKHSKKSRELVLVSKTVFFLWINKIVDNKEIEKDGPGNRGKP